MITKDLILENQLKQYIKTQNLKPGDRLPGERMLSEYFEVQRLTLRSSLQRLKNEGILTVKKNSGYYIADKRIYIPLGHAVSHFNTRNTENKRTLLLNILETEFSSFAMNKFPFDDNTGYRVIGLQTKNQIPYGVITGLIPICCIPELNFSDLQEQDLFELYRRHNQEITHGQEQITSGRACEWESMLLGVLQDNPVVCHHIYSYNQKGQCVLIQKIVYIQEKVEFGGW